MALQMRVYKEVSNVEAKVMLNLSWRQMLAAALMLAVGGGEAFVFFWLLKQPDLGTYLLFAVCVPFAAWGWWRPKGLKPERYAVYVLRHAMGQSVYLRDGRPARTRTGKPSMNEHERTARRKAARHA
ncbi:PrgI family protein [Bifidobacterium sp. SO1]|uniref:PrgI family protein n=1 Tax=Bifidobacterium sp. SO1 TaxID=2809029 RepID=UPI001BDCFD20|nr:PrgI family protein [Bifidobacterium sp. SO1]MBT1160926.1 PrgI family protein [Bifidobacterium sp. SO1]